MVRQSAAARSEVTLRSCPLVSKALARAGPIAVRNRATVGGTLAHCDRSAELPGVAAALGATLIAESVHGQREISAEEFFLGDMVTALDSEEFLRAAVFPAIDPSAFTAFKEVGLRREGVAVMGLAAVVLLGDPGILRQVSLAVIGVEPTPVRLKKVESQLAGQTLNEATIENACAAAGDAIDPIDDTYTTAVYRRAATRSLLGEVLRDAIRSQQEAAW